MCNYLHNFTHYKQRELSSEAEGFKSNSSVKIHLQHSEPYSVFLKLYNVQNKSGLTNLLREKLPA